MAEGVNVGNLWFGLDFKSSGDKDVNTKLKELKETLDQLVSGTHNIKLGFDANGGSGGGGGGKGKKDPVETVREQIKNIDEMMARMSKQQQIFKVGGVDTSGLDQVIEKAKQVKKEMEAAASSPDAAKKYLQETSSKVNSQIAPYLQLQKAISEVDRQISVLEASQKKVVNTDAIQKQIDEYKQFKASLEEISSKANISSQSMQGITQTMAKMSTETKKVTDETNRQARVYNSLDTILRNVSKKEIALQYKASTATDRSELDKALAELGKLKTLINNQSLKSVDDAALSTLKKYAAEVMARVRTLEQASNALNKKIGGSQGGANGLSQSRELSNTITQMRLIAQLQRQIEKNNYRKDAYGLDPARVREQNQELQRMIDSLNKLDTTKATRKDMAEQSISVQKLIQNVNHALNLEKQRSSTNSQISREIQHQTRLSQELASAFANYFSLSMVKQFLNDVIQIGGEFEIQHVALETILGDVAQANVLFSQLKEFSVKSPFQFRDIAQQTKQLAAFGIEEENLFETTKRLADMAAGLGVDFGRLALALGETKSRTWLDAKELRQFAYAGVPLLQKLSEYYSEVQGKMVSTADVRKMITKRMVSYEDTYRVIEKMTDAGGMFYNMQEKMADTVAGKWSNLRDAYDIMLSEIEKGNNEVLKGSIQMIMDLMKSWETWLPAVSGLAVGLIAFNGALAITSNLMGAIAKTGALIAAHPWMALIAAVVGIGTAVYTAYQNTTKLNRELESMSTKSMFDFEETNRGLAIMTGKLKSLTESVDRQKKSIDGMNKSSNEAKEAMKSYNNAVEKRKNLISEMNSTYGNFFSDQIREADNWGVIEGKIRNATEAARVYYATSLQSQMNSSIQSDYQDRQLKNLENLRSRLGNTVASEIMAQINEDHGADAIIDNIASSYKGFAALRRNYVNSTFNAYLNDNEKNLFAARDLIDEMVNEYQNMQVEMVRANRNVTDLFGTAQRNATNAISGDRGTSDGPTTPEPQRGERDRELQQWQKRLQILKKLISEYRSLSDLYGETVAKARINENQSYSGILSWFGIGDFTKEDDALNAALKKLESMGLSTDERLNAKESLQLDIDNVGINIEKNAVEDAKKKLEREIKEITSKWKIFDDWFGATGNREFASQMAFGGNISFGNLAEEIEAKLNQALTADGSSLNAKELVDRLNKEGLDSISRDFGKDSPIVKMVQQLSEEYMKLDEATANTLLDIVKNHRTAEQEIRAIDEKLAKNIKAVRENSALDEETKNELVRGLREDAEKERSKKLFEQFQNTDGWAKAFEDLDRVSTDTIDNMIERISRFINTTGLSITEIRSLQNAMKKLRAEKIERDPFRMIADSIGRITSARRNLSYMRNAGVDRITAADPNATRYNPATGKIEQGKKTVTTKENEQDDLQAGYADLDKSIAQVCKQFDALAQAADLVTNLLDAMGVDTSGAVGSVLSSATSGIQTGASIVNSLGLQNMGPWGAAAGAALSVTTALFQLHDKSIQKEIDASKERQEEMENLASNLEDVLEKTMGSIYSFSSNDKFNETLQKIIDYDSRVKDLMNLFSFINGADLNPYREETVRQARTAQESGTYYDAQLAALMAQYDEAVFQYKKEQEKKKSDDSVLKDYEQSIHELKGELDSFVQDMANALYSIDFKSWADDLSSALVDAWAAGEDAAEAWKKTVADILKDTAVSVISQKYIQEMLVPVMEEFMADFESKKGMIDENSMAIVARMFGIADEAAKTTAGFMDAVEGYAKQYGVSLKDTEKSASSGLSAGISSITEDTADLLASYVNAIRADVSAIRHINELLLGDSDLGGMTAIQQSQLSQLILIETNTRRNTEYANQIYDLLRQATNGSKKIYVS